MFRPLTTRVWRAVFEGEVHKLLNPASGRYGHHLRALGAQGTLSPSRSRPELTHVTLFIWNSEGGASVQTPQEQPIPF